MQKKRWGLLRRNAMEAAPPDHIQMFIKVINLNEIVFGLSGEIYGDHMVLEDQNFLDQLGIRKNSIPTRHDQIQAFKWGLTLWAHQLINHSIKKSSSSLTPHSETDQKLTIGSWGILRAKSCKRGGGLILKLTNLNAIKGSKMNVFQFFISILVACSYDWDRES